MSLKGQTHPPPPDQGRPPSVDNTAADHDKGLAQSRDEGAAAPGQIKVQGCRKERGGEEKRKTFPPLLLLSISHLLPAHRNAQQLLRTLQGDAAAEERPGTPCRRQVFEFCSCLCQVNSDVPAQSRGGYSSPPHEQ